MKAHIPVSRVGRVSRLFLSACLVFTCGGAFSQTVPPLINYQGQLMQPNGQPLPTADYTLTFSIYETAQGGTPIWGPQIFNGQSGPGYGPKIPVVQGYFNVMLGPKDTAERPLAEAFAGYPRYVEIKVGSNPAIAPRQQILSAPYAMRAAYASEAGNAQTVQGKPPGDFVSKAGDTMTGTLVVPANGFGVSGNQLVLANNNVGIGTSSPSARVHVLGEIMSEGTAGLGSVISLKSTAVGGHQYEWYNDAASSVGTLALYDRTAGTIDLAVAPNGNVGIGTTSPQDRMHIEGGSLKITGSGPVYDPTATGLRLGGGTPGQTSFSWIQSWDGPLALNSYANNVGIGTTTPEHKLHVAGAVSVSGGNKFIARYENPSLNHCGSLNWNSLQMGNNGQNYIVAGRTTQGGALTFVVNNTKDYQHTDNPPHNGIEALQIRSNGYVGIGRNAASFKLELEGDASKTIAGHWNANSDIRIKQEIESVQNAMEKLEQVRLVSFRYTDEYRQAHPLIQDRRYLNVVAQEFAEVFPDAVSGSGEKLSDGHEILAVDTYPLTIYSAAAIQELNQRLQAKETQVTNLEKRVADLEKLVQSLATKLDGGRK